MRILFAIDKFLFILALLMVPFELFGVDDDFLMIFGGEPALWTFGLLSIIG